MILSIARALHTTTLVTVVVTIGAISGSAASLNKTSVHMFKVGSKTFYGTDNNNVCVIDGKWSDGAPLHYKAWDKCAKMSIYHPTKSYLKDAVSLLDGEPDIKVIPKGTELFRVENGVSTVLVFRDRKGNVKSITTGD